MPLSFLVISSRASIPLSVQVKPPIASALPLRPGAVEAQLGAELPERVDEVVVELLGRLRLAELRDAAFNGLFHCAVRCPR